MQLRNPKTLKYFALALLVLALSWRVYVAIQHQSRAWIDEMWVALCPAYKLLTGAGELKGDWMYEIRSWLPPSLVLVWLKALDALGVRDGRVVLAVVRLIITLANFGAIVFFVRALGRQLGLKKPPVLALLVTLFIPELVHYGTLADLSVLGLPFLLFGLALGATWLGAALLALAALIRFQYGVFPAALLVWSLARRDRRAAVRLAVVGVAALAFEVAFNSWMYGRFVFPLASYLRGNTTGGMAASYGIAPFYLAFEILWRFMSEPVFVLTLATAALAWKRLPFLTLSTVIFYAIHVVVGHKEYRFFYGPAVLFAALSGSVFQSWIEARPARLKWAAAFVLAFAIVAGWRAEKKVRWADYEVPSKLETFVGAQSDVRGLVTYGWNGIYAGCHYTFYNTGAYVNVSRPEELKALQLYPQDYNYVVAPESEPAPCAEKVKALAGAAAYRCEPPEISNLWR